jgi:membrane protein implicated in regulation of membrane protease activity
MGLFLAPECLPFAIGAVMLAALTVLEMLSMLVGFSLGEMIDKSLGGEHHASTGLFSWLNAGGVPILVLLLLSLGLFSMAGFAIQAVAHGVWGLLPAPAAAVAAFVVAMPAVRYSSEMVAHLIPSDETYAVEPADFVGRSARVTIGPLDHGLPGRVRLKDQHSNWHELRARAAPDQPSIPIGATVLLVDVADSIFLAIPTPPDLYQDPTSKELP